MSRIKELRLSTFTLTNLDDELFCMAMIRALGPDYYHFTSFLALLTDLDKDKVKVVFQTEEINRRPRPDGSSPLPSDSVLSANAGTCTCNPNAPCSFYEKTGHCQCKCFALQCARENYKSSKHKGKRANQANSAATTTASGSSSSSSTAASAAANAVSTPSQNAQDIIERAGNASFRFSDPCDPLSPLQLDADVDWNANSGVTSHMTPHCHWLRKYTPYCMSIKLADNTVVYSAGVGFVVFNPVIEGQSARVVEFT